MSTTTSTIERPYDGGAYLIGSRQGRVTGVLGVAKDAIVFEGNGQTLDLPLRGLVLESTGFCGSVLLFRHAERQGTVLYTTDRRILAETPFRVVLDLSRQVSRLERKRSGGIRLFTLGVLAVPLGLVLLFALKDPIIALVVAAVPRSWDAQVGEQAYAEISRHVRFLSDEEARRRAETLLDPLLAVAREQGYEIHIHLSADPTVNAFALPGGHIILNSGLILEAQSPEEILGVIAHEIAHVTCRHGMKQIASSVGMLIVLKAIFGGSSNVAAALAANSHVLLTMRSSRGHEVEADETGWNYLVEAKVDPRGLIRFFKRLEQAECIDMENSIFRYFSSHPGTSQRIERLESRWEEFDRKSGFRRFSGELKRLQGRIRQSGGVWDY
jgi:Zn-dependent protease with chaperone function